jgi:hypothetical protein
MQDSIPENTARISKKFGMLPGLLAFALIEDQDYKLDALLAMFAHLTRNGIGNFLTSKNISEK